MTPLRECNRRSEACQATAYDYDMLFLYQNKGFLRFQLPFCRHSDLFFPSHSQTHPLLTTPNHLKT